MLEPGCRSRCRDGSTRLCRVLRAGPLRGCDVGATGGFSLEVGKRTVVLKAGSASESPSRFFCYQFWCMETSLKFF